MTGVGIYANEKVECEGNEEESGNFWMGGKIEIRNFIDSRDNIKL